MQPPIGTLLTADRYLGGARQSCLQKVETVDTDIRETEDCREEKVEKVLQVELPRRASGAESLMMEEQKRRFSEAGVNRRPSAAHILTEVRMMRFDNQDVEEINIEGVCLLHRA